MVTSESIVEV